MRRSQNIPWQANLWHVLHRYTSGRPRCPRWLHSTNPWPHGNDSYPIVPLDLESSGLPPHEAELRYLIPCKASCRRDGLKLRLPVAASTRNSTREFSGGLCCCSCSCCCILQVAMGLLYTYRIHSYPTLINRCMHQWTVPISRGHF